MDMNYEEQAQGGEVAGFIGKTFQILNNQQFSKIIFWGPTGTQFIIKDISKFQQVVLPKYFRHNKINSFIRQLNMYGFHKSRKDHSKSVFSHPLFLKNREYVLSYCRDLLGQVKRKVKSDEQEQTQKFQTPAKIQKLVKQDIETGITGKQFPLPQAGQRPITSLKQFNILETVNSSFMKLFQSKQNFFSKQQFNFSLNKMSQNCIGEVVDDFQQKDDDIISIEQGIQEKQERQKQISYPSNNQSITKFQNPSCFFNSFISKD